MFAARAKSFQGERINRCEAQAAPGVRDQGEDRDCEFFAGKAFYNKFMAL